MAKIWKKIKWMLRVFHYKFCFFYMKILYFIFIQIISGVAIIFCLELLLILITCPNPRKWNKSMRKICPFRFSASTGFCRKQKNYVAQQKKRQIPENYKGVTARREFREFFTAQISRIFSTLSCNVDFHFFFETSWI